MSPLKLKTGNVEFKKGKEKRFLDADNLGRCLQVGEGSDAEAPSTVPMKEPQREQRRDLIKVAKTSRETRKRWDVFPEREWKTVYSAKERKYQS